MSRFLIVFILALSFSLSAVAESKMARGLVFDDRNGNGVRDDGEPGLAGIGVSNRQDVAVTDQEGKWSLAYDEDTIFFVIKPEGWAVPVNANQIPQFYYIHKPGGSRTDFQYPGLKPTGPLPESIDFPLTKSEEPETFKAIFFGDPQPRSIDEVDYIAHDVIEELIGTDARFGVTLGDIMFDRLELFEPSNANLALIGIPWYNVIGNHDLNFEAQQDKDSDETFHRFFGPNYYSFNYGPVHFVVLDDVDWGTHHRDDGKASYRGGLNREQIDFVKNDLALVPEGKLVCLMMHIPLLDIGNRKELYRLIEKRPYTMSISGHTHWHAHQYIGKEDDWQGEEPHHHIVNVTVSGSWWHGAKNELGIPHATMRDGAPNGYSIITFDGVGHTLDFKAAGYPEDYQMNIYCPDSVAAEHLKETPLYVNVFNGSEKSVVKFRVAGGEWSEMKQVREKDPYYVALAQRDVRVDPGYEKNHVRAVDSSHLWKHSLPDGLQPGSVLIEVSATDAYGREHKGRRILRVK